MKKYKVIDAEGTFKGYVYTEGDIEHYSKGMCDGLYFKELYQEFLDGF